MPVDPSSAAPPLIILSVAAGYGGAERNIEIVVRHLVAERRIVVFACNAYHTAELARIRHPNLSIETVDVYDRHFIDAAARRLIALDVRLRPAAIWANTLDSAQILARAALWHPRLDQRSFLFVHDFLWKDLDPLAACLPQSTLFVPDHVVLERPGYAERLAWPNGSWRALVMPTPVELPAAAQDVPAGEAPFLHLATVNGFKGHHCLVEAAALLKRQGHRIKVASYGHRPNPELFAALERHLAACEAADVLSLHDHVDDPAALLAACRAVVVPSVSDNGGPETFGRAIVEAWAQARPVIAFAVGAPAHLIRHDVDGLLVREHDIDGLAAAMLRLHTDPTLAARLGAAGRARAEREFAAAITVPQIRAVLDGAWHCHLPVAELPPHPPGGEPALAMRCDVTDVLRAGWAAPTEATGGEGARLEAAAPPEALLVCRDSNGDAPRPLAPHELEFLAQGRGPLAVLAARALSTCPPRARPAPRRVGLGHGILIGIHRLAGHPLSKSRLVRSVLLLLRRTHHAPSGAAVGTRGHGPGLTRSSDSR